MDTAHESGSDAGSGASTTRRAPPNRRWVLLSLRGFWAISLVHLMLFALGLGAVGIEVSRTPTPLLRDRQVAEVVPPGVCGRPATHRSYLLFFCDLRDHPRLLEVFARGRLIPNPEGHLHPLLPRSRHDIPLPLQGPGEDAWVVLSYVAMDVVGWKFHAQKQRVSAVHLVIDGRYFLIATHFASSGVEAMLAKIEKVEWAGTSVGEDLARKFASP